MYMNKKILFIAFSVISFQVVAQNVSFAEEINSKIGNTYENYQYCKDVEKIEALSYQKDRCLYEISPSDPEWSELTYLEQLEVCDMPEKFLNECSTWDLSEYVLEYPFLFDIYAFESTEQGINHLINTSNVCKEFFSRNDAKEVLLEKYDNLIVDYNLLSEEMDYIDDPLSQSGYDKELFLQSYFGNKINDLNSSEKEKLKGIISEKYEQKKGKCDEFATSFLIYDEIQKIGESIPNEIVANNIANDLMAVYSDSSDGFTEFGSELFYVNEAVRKVGLYKKYGTSVGCYQYVSGDYTDKEISNIDAKMHSTHPTWIRILPATKTYNCHSYAWLEQIVFNKYWIANPDFFAKSSSFNKIGANCAAQDKDKIIIDGLRFQQDGFGNTMQALHSVIVYSGGTNSSNIQTHSKLGSCGVYKASLGDMMNFYGGATYRVYRKK